MTDHLGTVRDLVDDSGDVINHLDYDSFGNIIAQSNISAADRYTYTGREFDSETGFFYYRARYYDAHLGRFISQDPIGFAAGDANLYRYVGNQSLVATDPSGMTPVSDYLKNLWAGPVGALVRSSQFQCHALNLGGYAVGKGIERGITGKWSLGPQEVGSLALGGISCTMFPTSAFAQITFLSLTEIFYLHATGASATDIMIAGVMHTFGVAGNSSALSRHAGEVWGSLRQRLPDLVFGESGQGDGFLGTLHYFSEAIEEPARQLATQIDSLARRGLSGEDISGNVTTARGTIRARQQGQRMTSRDNPLEQFEEIEAAQRKVRQGKSNKIIDSIEKSKQRDKNRLREMRNDPDLLDS